MARRETGWTFYFSAALICILGLWALYIWQLRLERHLTAELAADRLEQGEPVLPRQSIIRSPRRPGQHRSGRTEDSTPPWARRSVSDPLSLPKPGLIVMRRSSAETETSDARLTWQGVAMTSSEIEHDSTSREGLDQVPTQPSQLPPAEPDSLTRIQPPAQLFPPRNTSGNSTETESGSTPRVSESPTLTAPSGAIRVANVVSQPADDPEPTSTTTSESGSPAESPDGAGVRVPPNPFRLSSDRSQVQPGREIDMEPATDVRASADTQSTEAPDEASETITRPSPWPAPEMILEQLAELGQDPRLHTYCRQLESLIENLREFESLAEPGVKRVLDELGTRADTLPASISQVAGDQRVRVAENRFHLLKRVAVWTAVHIASIHRPVNWVATDALALKRSRAAQMSLEEVGQFLKSDPIGGPWYDYLMIRQLRDALVDGEVAETESELIRKVLRRMQSSRLTPDQREFLNTEPMASLRRDLGPMVKEEIRLEDLLALMEAYDTTHQAAYERLIARSIENYRWSDDDRRQALAEQLEVNYRNANLRFTVSEALLNRMLPEMAAIREPVNDRLLGARVMGTSETSNDLHIQLVPDEERLHLGLQANGVVSSRTRAFKDGFIFHNRGQARYRASKFLSFDRNGILVSDADAEATSAQETTDVQSDFDLFPVIGSLARSIAIQQKNEKERLANRIVEQKVAMTARQRLDEEIQAKLVTARSRLRNEVIDPLHAMGLEPQPIDLETTQDRLIIRYRLAGPEQLAADSPRPQALTASLASFQIHESVIGNFAGGLDLGGKSFDIPGLVSHLSEKLKRPLTLEKEVQDKVVMEFPETGWLQTRFQDGRVHIQLTFNELSLNDDKPWRNLTVEAIYLPMIDGKQIRLFRDPEEAIRVSGRRIRIRDQFAILGIMNVVFKPEQVIDVIPEEIINDPRLDNTAIGQLVIESGWMAVSIVDDPQAVSPTQPEQKSADRPVRRLLNEVLR